MPTSATGNSNNEAGFTLVEALTALLVIALMVGAVMLVLPGPERETRAFAERFAARLALAGEESVIANRPVALVLSEEGYGFARLEENGWRELGRGTALAFRPWPAHVEARLEGADDLDAHSVRFDPIGAATPARIIIAGAGARWRVELDGQGRAHVARAD